MDIDQIIADSLDQNLDNPGVFEEVFDIDQLDEFINDVASDQKLDAVLRCFDDDPAVPPPSYTASDYVTSPSSSTFEHQIYLNNDADRLPTAGSSPAQLGSCYNAFPSMGSSTDVMVSCHRGATAGEPQQQRYDDTNSAPTLVLEDVSAAKVSRQIALLASAFLQNQVASPHPDPTSSQAPDSTHWLQRFLAGGLATGPSGELDSSPISIDAESDDPTMSPRTWDSVEQQTIAIARRVNDVIRFHAADVSGLKSDVLVSDFTPDDAQLAANILSSGENSFYPYTPPESGSSVTSPYLCDQSNVSECDLSLSDRSFCWQVNNETKLPAVARCRDVTRATSQPGVHRVIELGNSSSADSFEPLKKKKRKLSARSTNRGKINGENDQDIKVQFEQGPENSDDEPLDRLTDVSLLGVNKMSWTDHQPENWSLLLDERGSEIKTVDFRVDCDKGFNFQFYDSSFVCQKKNHFQVTAEAGYVNSTPAIFVCPSSGSPLPITGFYLHFHGIKTEMPSYRVPIEQSEADRSKHSMDPIRIDMKPNRTVKAVAPRMHFSETTANNMRKRGKPNPDQRYFQLVVSLCVYHNDTGYVVAAKVSDKIIVRASNPGQFENDTELMWIKGKSPDSVFHVGSVGINTDCPDEALTVHGNIHLTGRIVAPSDVRVKHNFQELDTTAQLSNISKLKLYSYDFVDEFSDQVNIPQHSRSDAGVLAQDLREVLPEAVVPSGTVTLSNGDVIEDFLLVNKERLFFENIGAVKELCKVACKLETRIDEMEIMNKKLSKLSRSKSVRSTASTSSTFVTCTEHRQVNCQKCSSSSRTKNSISKLSKLLCTNRAFRLITVILVIVMTLCVAAVTALYLVTKQSSSTSTDKPANNTNVPVNVNQLANNSTSQNNQGNSVASFDFGNNSSKSDAPEPPGCPFGTSACNSTACCALTFPPPPSPSPPAADAADAQASTLDDQVDMQTASPSASSQQDSLSTANKQSESGDVVTPKVRRKRASELNLRRNAFKRLY